MLGEWCAEQAAERAAGTMPQARRELLDSIAFDWAPPPPALDRVQSPAPGGRRKKPTRRRILDEELQ